MNKPTITLKNVKIAQFASEETLCFEATVYVDGKAFCTASNGGKGGPNEFHPIGGYAKHYDLMNDIEVIGKRIHPLVMTRSEADEYNEKNQLGAGHQSWDEYMAARDANLFAETAYEAFDNAVEAALSMAQHEKDLKRLLSKRIMFVRDGKLLQTNAAKNAAQLKAWLHETQIAKFNAEVVLNNVPFAQALELYRKHG